MSMVKTDTAKQKSSVAWLRTGTIIAGVGGLWLLSQVIWAAASAAAGVAVIGVIGVVGIAVFQSLPMLAQKWENRLLGMRKAEARANPIEQAENDFLRRTEQYNAFKQALAKIGGQITSLKSRLKGMKSESPTGDFSAEAEALKKMELFYTNRLERVTLAKEKLDAFQNKIKEARMKWDFQLAANDAIKAMNATDRESQMNQMLTSIAFDSVQQEFDQVFAKIDVDAAEISAQKQMTFGGGMTLDLTAIEVPQLEHAGAH